MQRFSVKLQKTQWFKGERSIMKTRRFNRNKLKKLSIIGSLGLVLALGHQNCAPSPFDEGFDGPDVASPVDTIDNVNRDTAVSFSFKTVELGSELEEVSLKGICSLAQEGAVLGWEVRKEADGSGEGEFFANGLASCHSGQFAVELAPAQELECDQPYKVHAQLGSGKMGSVQISRRCRVGER
jgi:hypothetical protein